MIDIIGWILVFWFLYKLYNWGKQVNNEERYKFIMNENNKNAKALMVALKALKDIAHRNPTNRVITDVEDAYAEIKQILGVDDGIQTNRNNLSRKTK